MNHLHTQGLIRQSCFRGGTGRAQHFLKRACSARTGNLPNHCPLRPTLHTLFRAQRDAQRWQQQLQSSCNRPLDRWGRLFQEYACMALAKTEMHNLRWYESNQAKIRADLSLLGSEKRPVAWALDGWHAFARSTWRRTRRCRSWTVARTYCSTDTGVVNRSASPVSQGHVCVSQGRASR